MIDWDDAFDNSGYAPGSSELPEKWTTLSSAFRASHEASELDVSYGAHPREMMDLFFPKNAKGLMVFVHGGYWHKFDKTYWSHLARGYLARGWVVAIPSYPLAPEARISQMVTSIARAIEVAADKVDGPIRLAGHSAGGHIVTRMICGNVPLNAALRERLVRITSISGVHDLRPLLHTKMNDILQLDTAAALSESPALLTPTGDCPVTFWVGAQERPEFVRQTRIVEEHWALSGLYPRVEGLPPAETGVSSVYEVDQNHFTVIDALTDPLSPITQACLL